MLRLENITFHRLGNIAPGTALRFSDRGALLLGRNGSGKTTLLNNILDALCFDWQSLARQSNDGFELEYTLRIHLAAQNAVRLHVRLHGAPLRSPQQLWFFDAPMTAGHSFEVTVTDDAGTLLVDITATKHQTTYSFPDGRTSTHPVSSHTLPSAFALLEDNGDMAFEGAWPLAQYLTRQLALLHRYDEALHYFGQLTEEDHEPRVVVSFAYQGQAFGAAEHHSFVPSEATCRLLQHAAIIGLDAAEHPRVEAPHHPSSQPLAWLEAFRDLCGFDKASISFPLVDSKTSSNMTVVTYGPMDLRYSTHGANLQDHHLSFGQKRLFSLLHYFDAHQSLVLADELVNGLHHEWIQHCIDLAETRQSFLSSQNPLLFDFMHFSSPHDAADRFIECTLDEAGRFLWRNMSLEDTSEFYAVYQSGIQHVSEILRTRGYWKDGSRRACSRSPRPPRHVMQAMPLG